MVNIGEIYLFNVTLALYKSQRREGHQAWNQDQNVVKENLDSSAMLAP